MAYENTVLSLNPDGQTLSRQESALRQAGFEVISVSTPLQARFEIEMGRCGVFLSGYITSLPIYRDLASLFKRSCPNGVVVFLLQFREDMGPSSDVLLSDSDEPDLIVQKVRSIRSMQS